MSRVIIVEDEGLVARSMAKMLVLHGHEVPACVATGGDAIAAAESLAPDLVLMDIHLHGPMDGIEAARQIRVARDIPIIFLTAYADRDHLERAKLTEPYAYLLKPYSDRELLTTIEIVVNKHGLERELRQRERWLGTTLRSIGDGVIAVTTDQRIELMNAEAERLTGWTNQEAVGRPVGEVLRLVAEDTGGPRELPLARAMSDGSVHGLDGPTLLIDRQGSELPIDDSVAAISDDRGVVLGGVVVFRDVTERRMMESRLALADRMASMATLTAGIGHELNNPLSYNLGNLDLVLSRLPAVRRQLEQFAAAPDPRELASVVSALAEIEKRLDDARVGADRMRDILGTLRGFARPAGAEVRLVSIADPVEAALRFVSNEIAMRGYVVRDFRASPRVRGHEGQLCQVFTNLLVNAAQSLAESTGAARPLRVVVDETDQDAIVEIVDSGPGIPAEVMVRIFEPFFTTKPLGVGTGLGLAIVHNIVKAHHGEITVASKLGEGSTFRVRLPRVVSADTPAVGIAAQPGRRTVLIVDDEPIVGEMLGLMLEPHHDVVVVTSGGEALERILVQEPDVILSDLMMPEMTGMELHAQLLARRPELARRMLFLTGGAFTTPTQAFVATMSGRVLLKPIRLDDLLAVIATVIDAPP